MALHSIALCAGVGMLDEGLGAGLDYLGIAHRAVCYVEREAPAAGQLAGLMAAGIIDQAPVWSDLTTFNARAWRGRVHCVTAGFPCQPWSSAGKRLGMRDPRWLWPSIAGIIERSGAQLAYLENVRQLVGAGGLAPVLGDLADLGFDAEWEVLRASDVGAAHRRERVFILAYRDGARDWLGSGRIHDAQPHRSGSPRASDAAQPGQDSGEMAYRQGDRLGRWRPTTAPHRDAHRRHPRLADADRQQPERAIGEFTVLGSGARGRGLADAGGARRKGRERCRALRRWRAHGSAAELCRLFAPGPADARWAQVLQRAPWLAPATEPGVRGLVDGLALVVDESRRHQLHEIGNGVVALQAAAAFVRLARRAALSA